MARPSGGEAVSDRVPEGLLGPLETEVMEVVWQLGDVTVRDVHRRLSGRREIAYTTVMTTMSRLAAKGLLLRDRSGTAHRYQPSVSRDEFARSTVDRVVRWLVSSFPEPAMSAFAEAVGDEDDLDADELDALRRRVERARRREG